MADEFRNTVTGADPLPFGLVTVGTAATGTIEDGADQDVFTVQLLQGQTYVFDVRGSVSAGGTLGDPQLTIRNGSGTLLAENDDGGPGLESRLLYSATFTGTHYLDVGGFGAGAGTYTIDSTTQRGFAAPVLRLAEFGSAAGGWTGDDLYHREVGDVNGDNRDDIVGFGFGGVTVSLAIAGGGFTAPFVALGAFGASAAAGSWTSEDLYSREVADVNGDGRDDIIGFGFGGVSVALATGGGTFAAPNLVLAAFGSGTAAGGWTSDLLYNREMADVNGDNRADIVGFGIAGVTVSLATGGGNFAAAATVLNNFGVSAAGGGWTDNDRYARKLGDVNGDNRADIIGFGEGGTFVSLATGGGNFAAPIFALANYGQATGWTSDNTLPREIGDVNGDNRDDIVGFGANGVTVAFSKGDGTFFDPVFMRGDFGSNAAAGGWASEEAFPRELGDVNNDGSADIYGFSSMGVMISQYTGIF